MAGTINSVKALINGQEYTLSLNSSTGKYEAQLIAPADSSFNAEDGYFPVSITAAYSTGLSATVNDKSEGAIGQACRFVVKERVKPTALITYPTQGQYITSDLQKIEFSVRDNASQTSGYSGINLNSLVLRISGAALEYDIIINDSSKINATAVTGGYDCVYSAEQLLPDGTYTCTLTVEDNDGNLSDSVSTHCIIDTAPPEISLTSPVEGLSTADSSILISGVTSDITSSPVSISLSVDGENKGNIPVNSDGSFSETFVLSSPGNHVLVVSATDSAGKTSSITRNIYFSTDMPVISSVLISPNPADAGTMYTISVEVS